MFIKTVEDIVRNGKLYCNKDTKQLLPRIESSLSLNNKVPTVIRFGQLTENEYSGGIGRKEAKRVFASHLGAVWKMTIQDATRYSGYSVTPSTSNEKKLFVWIFIPSDAVEVVPATWSEIIPQLNGWMK
jgi:hypothetical protein